MRRIRIRSFHQFANSSFCHPFQQFQLSKASCAHLHPVAIETSSLVHDSSIHWCGRSYAASSSSNTLEAKTLRRRISKDERESVVKNYVNRYREMNAGKFPSATDVRKNVGGSYYSVRKVLQELIYYSRMPLMETKESVSLEKNSAKKDEICTDSGGVFERKKLEHKGSNSISKVDEKDDSSKSFKLKEGLKSPISDQIDISKHDGPQSHRLVNEPKSSLQSDPENSNNHGSVHEDKLNIDALGPNSEPEQSSGSDVSGSESHKVPTVDAGLQRKSSVWQSLRSFANGILGVWKRS